MFANEKAKKRMKVNDKIIRGNLSEFNEKIIGFLSKAPDTQ
jgi:hypothetical protein